VTRRVGLAAIVSLMAACRAGPDAEAARFTIVREFQPPPAGSFWAPIDLAATAQHVWVLDVGAAQVYGYAPDGAYRVTLGKPGAGPGELKEPLALGVAGDSLWVLNAGNRRIEYYAASAHSLGSALGSEPLPDSLPPPIDMVRLGSDWYATTPFLPEPVVRFHSGGSAWTTFGSEVVEAAAKLKPRAASIPDAYRIEVEDGRVWVLHLYLPVLGVYDRSGKLDRVVTYSGEEIEARAPVEQDGGEGRVRRLIRAPRSPAGGLGLLRVESGNYVLTHQRAEGRQMLYRIVRDVGPERDGRIQKHVASEREGRIEVEVADRPTVMPPRMLFLTSIRSHGRTYAVGTKGEYEEPSVFVLE
jgi:hypothetical protein